MDYGLMTMDAGHWIMDQPLWTKFQAPKFVCNILLLILVTYYKL